MIILVLVGIFFFLVLYVLWVFRARPMVLPGPPHLPILGATLEVTKNLPRFSCYIGDCFNKYAHGTKTGTWGLSIFGNERMIFVTDPESLKYILGDNGFDNFIKGPKMKGAFYEMLGEGIIGQDGANWRKRRKVASHLFSARMLRNVMTQAFCTHAEIVLEIFRKHAESGAPLDLQRVFFAYTMDSVCDIAFKKKLGSLQKPHPFTIAFDKANVICYQRLFDPTWKIMKFLNLGEERKMTGYAKIMDSFLAAVVNERSSATVTESKNEYVDVMTTFIQLYRKRGETIDKEFLRDVAMTFIIAGRDTTGFLLTIIAYHLTQHPEIEEKVLQEVITVLGPSGEVNYDNYKRLHYLHAFIYECVRMYPPVPHDIKYAVNATTLPDGTHLSSGDMICYPAWAQGRDPRIWKDPLKFQPERWIDANGKFQMKDQYAFIAFNAGQRLCLGKEMSVLQTKIIVSKMIRKYRFIGQQKIFPGQDAPFLDAATLSWTKGLEVTIEARK